MFREVLKRTNKHICIDRFTACQWVYGNLHDKGAPDLNYLRFVELKMKQAGGFFVYTAAHVDDIIKRFKQHNEKDIDINQISKVLIDYEEYLCGTQMPVLRINTSILSIEEAVRQIIEFADQIDKQVI